jgi:epoxyqueuosine reductase
MINDLLSVIRSHGNRGAVVPFSRIDDLKKDMVDLKNGEYHTDWLDRMTKHITGNENRFIPSDISFVPRSLISVVMPSPKVILQFCYRGNAIPCIVPPHYTNWYENNGQALQYIGDYLASLGYSIVTAETITQKLLAVHCGLGQYGRNNICYNDEFGSYIQIMTYISDMPCDGAAWRPLTRMEICDNCGACAASCPVGAIDSSRQLINSDRCITNFDELPDIEFPDWMDNGAHNSIVGCIKCQDCCPANAINKDNIKMGVTFSEAETLELLNNNGGTPYSESLAAKVAASGIPPEYAKPNVLPRNLRALLL